jgi:PAS domain S-box-containing protein
MGDDRDARLINPALCQILGYGPEELATLKMREITHPDDPHDNTNRMIVAGLLSDEYDRRFRHKDGHYVWCHLSTTRVLGDDGQTLSTVRLIQDISEKIKVGEALKWNEERLRLAVENSVISISLHRRESEDRMFNTTFADMLGYTMEEFEKLRLNELRAPDEILIGKQRRAEFADGKKDICVDIERFLHKNGAVVWCEATRKPIFDDAGNFTDVVTIRFDVTERTMAEQALRESEQRFRGIFESADIGISVSSTDQSVRLRNAALSKILGYTPEESSPSEWVFWPIRKTAPWTQGVDWPKASLSTAE